MVERRLLWIILLSVFVGGAAVQTLFAQAGQSQGERPNVVVFLSDDQGYGDFSYTGNRDLLTPNIDGLATAGLFQEYFYVCPVCSPTRAEFLTGRYAVRGGVYSTSAGGERLDLDEVTIADAFQASGYRTGAFGKWHNGTQAPYHPNTRGFGEFYGFCSGHWGNYFSPMLERNGKWVRGSGYCVDDFTDKAIQFIEKNSDKPFFVYLPYNTPHSPMQVPGNYWDGFSRRELTQLPPVPGKRNSAETRLQHSRAALAMCKNIDDNVGRVLKKLDELRLSENTIVVYFCDNGPNGWRYNCGFKGRKGSLTEGGLRSPLFVRWPKKIQPGTRVKSLSGAIDLFPTLAELCQIDPGNKKPLDGVSQADLWLGKKPPSTDRRIFSAWRNKVSVRYGLFRLGPNSKLYNIEKDPGERQEVTDRADLHRQLTREVEQFRSTAMAELGKELRPFTLGDARVQWTLLPARDGKATGRIERSNRFPNDSFFKNWVREQDSIEWPVDVMDGGRYRVWMLYCLDPENVGVEIRLVLGARELKKRILKSHQSPTRGPENDRVPRQESVVKDFGQLFLGEISLTPGPGKLVLQSPVIPGKESIEFRGLLFERLE